MFPGFCHHSQGCSANHFGPSFCLSLRPGSWVREQACNFGHSAILLLIFSSFPCYCPAPSAHFPTSFAPGSLLGCLWPIFVQRNQITSVKVSPSIPGFLFFGCTVSTWKFSGQGSNPSDSVIVATASEFKPTAPAEGPNPRCHRDKARSLTRCITAGTPPPLPSGQESQFPESPALPAK